MNAEWKVITVDVAYENTEKLALFVETNLQEKCSKKVCHQMAVAFDEIYSNVVKYGKARKFELRLGIQKDMVCMEFRDDGIPYNPLESEEPDVQAPKGERPIGGLGLYIVKRTMDFLEYKYEDECNIFTIGKKFI